MTTGAIGIIYGMNASEWLDISATLRARWPSATLPEAALKQWGVDLADLPGEQVAAAVEALYREGREFPPNGGQIRAKVAELAVAAPDWGWVVTRLAALLSLGPAYTGPDPERDEVVLIRHDPREDALDGEHPLIRGFVHAIGWGQISAGFGEGGDEARLREKWRGFVARAHREVLLRGIPSGGLRELRRIEEGQPKRLGEAVAAVAGQLERGDEAA